MGTRRTESWGDDGSVGIIQGSVGQRRTRPDACLKFAGLCLRAAGKSPHWRAFCAAKVASDSTYFLLTVGASVPNLKSRIWEAV
jgi:hypothetical protein